MSAQRKLDIQNESRPQHSDVFDRKLSELRPKWKQIYVRSFLWEIERIQSMAAEKIIDFCAKIERIQLVSATKTAACFAKILSEPMRW